jgi:hypothetical protein
MEVDMPFRGELIDGVDYPFELVHIETLYAPVGKQRTRDQTQCRR